MSEVKKPQPMDKEKKDVNRILIGLGGVIVVLVIIIVVLMFLKVNPFDQYIETINYQFVDINGDGALDYIIEARVIYNRNGNFPSGQVAP